MTLAITSDTIDTCMKTDVKKLSPTRVKVTIKLGSEELEAAEQVALTKLAKDVKAPGFRKGKVPASVVKKNVSAELLAQQTLDDALSKAVADAFIAENLQVIQRPEVDVKKFVPGQELEFVAEAEILPEIKLGDYKKLTAKATPVKVTKEEIDNVISRIASGMSEKKEVKRAAKNGDEAVIDFVGKKGDVPFDGGTGNDYPLTLGSNSFIPGFEEGIVGKKAGETFDLKLDFPKDYHVKDLAGEKVTFTTTLKTVNELIEPKLDAEFAAKAGPFKTMKELTDDIKRELTAQREKEAVEKQKDALVSELIEKSDVPVPEVLVDDQVRSIEQDMTQNLMYQGITMDQYIENQKFKDKDDWMKKEARPAAEKRVQAGLVLAELSKVEKIEASSEELAEHLNQYRSQYQNNPEMVKRFEEPEVQRDVANRLITEKTVDRLVELNSKKK